MPGHRVGRRWMFKQDEVDAWVRSGGAADRVNVTPRNTPKGPDPLIGAFSYDPGFVRHSKDSGWAAIKDSVLVAICRQSPMTIHQVVWQVVFGLS